MSRNSVTSGIAAGLILSVAAGSAFAETPTNPAILSAVQQLQVSVNALQSTVNNVQTNVGGIAAITSALATLQQAVDGLGQQSNVRLTPPVDVAAPGDLASCVAVNASSQPRTIHTQIMGLDGLVKEDLGSLVVQPGKGTGGGNRSGEFFYCKFTVVDGTKADIRGAMSVCTFTVCKQTVSAE